MINDRKRTFDVLSKSRGRKIFLRVLIVHTGANSPNIEADLLECFKNIAFLASGPSP